MSNFKYLIPLIISASVIFVGRLPIVVSPPYDVDEGIYATIGQSLNRGQLLYHDIWDNKPPAIYFLYSWMLQLASDFHLFRVIASLFLIITAILFFILIRKTLSPKRSLLALSLLTLLLTIPFFGTDSADAEIFFLPFSLGAILLTYLTTERYWSNWWMVVVGVLLAIGVLFKVVVMFDGLAIVSFLAIKNYRLILIPLRNIVIGAIIVLITPGIYIISNHLGPDFLNAALIGNVSYVGSGNSDSSSPLLKLVFLTLGLVYIFKFSRESTADALISLWLVWVLFGALLSGRPYLHYLIPTVPALVWLVSKVNYQRQFSWKKLVTTFSILLILWLGFGTRVSQVTTSHNLLSIISDYYPNAFKYLVGLETRQEFDSFFGNDILQTKLVSNYLDQNFGQIKILVWGSKPYIYFLSGDIPATRYTIAYHVDQDKSGRMTFLTDLTARPPDVIVITNDSQLSAILGSPTPDFPEFKQFVYANYLLKNKLGGADIYERRVYANARTP